MVMVTPVTVVTDSTASLPPGATDGLPLTLVPLHVVIDGHSRPESEHPGLSGEVAEALRRGRTVSTSKPGPDAFEATYRRLFDEGAGHIVSVHLSSAISGTYDAALQAADRFDDRVHVVDSRTVAMACGFAALAGAQLAGNPSSVARPAELLDQHQDEPADPAPVVERIHARAAGTTTYFLVGSLEYLRRGGRIGAASALLGSSLAIKPLLRLSDGVIGSYERVRTTARAHARLVELAADAVRHADTNTDVAIHHLDDAASAHRLADALTDLAEPDSLVISELSSVLAVHVGPGTLGIVVSPRNDRAG